MLSVYLVENMNTVCVCVCVCVPNHSRAVALASGEEECPWCKIKGS